MKFKWIKWRYFLTYFSAFLVVFMSSVLICAVAGDALKRDSIKWFETKYAQGISDVQNMIERMDLVEDVMKQNQSFRKLAECFGEFQISNTTKLSSANKLMSELGMITNIEYFFVLFEENDVFVSNTQCTSKFQNHYGVFLKMESDRYGLENAQEMKETLFAAARSGEQFIPIDRVSYVKGSEHTMQNALLYLVEGSYGAVGGRYIFGFVIDHETLHKMFFGENTDKEGFFEIVNAATGEIIYQDNDPVTGSEYHIIIGDGGRWNIRVGISLDFIHQTLAPAYRILVIFLVGGLFLVVILTIGFSLRRYKGFSGVMSQIFAEKEVERNTDGEMPAEWSRVENIFRESEYKVLEKLVKGQRQNSDHWRRKYEEVEQHNQIIMLEQMFTSEIRGTIKKELLIQNLGKLPEFYCVAVARLIPSNTDHQVFYTTALIQLLNQHAAAPFLHVHSGDSDEIFLFTLENSQNVQAIKGLLIKCIGLLTDMLDGNVHVGISAVGTKLASINRRYEQAVQVVNTLSVNENRNMVWLFDYNHTDIQENLVNLDFLNRIHDKLICGRKEDALSDCDKLREALVKNPFLYELQKEQIYYALRNVFGSVFLLFGKNEELNMMIPMYQKECTVDDMMNIFQEAVEEICKYIENRKKNSDILLRKKIVGYLEERYADSALNAHEVSRDLKVSVKYLTQVLKEETGETFSSFLLKIRLEKSIEYLEKTDYSNEKIAELTGFGAANTFYRNFSKKMGMSPKAYKDETVNRRLMSDEIQS